VTGVVAMLLSWGLITGVPAAEAASATGSAAPPALLAPLATGLTTSTGSWAVVAMGQPGVLLNTFWQIFFEAPGSGSWALVTPGGVADNGGLTLSVASGGTALMGFQPSQLLHYSPLARSTNNGATWTAALLPSALFGGPSALSSAGTSGTALALVRHGAGQVLSSSGSLTTWIPISGSSDVANGAAALCRVDGLDAVAVAASGTPMVGTGCRRPGQVGVFAHVGSHWSLIGPSLQGSLSRSTTRVLQLNGSDSIVTGLVAEREKGRTGLLALWRSPSGAWSFSQPLVIGAGQHLRSTAVAGGGGQLILLQAGRNRAVLDEVPGPGQPWSTLPSPPPGTVTLAPLPNGSITAFSVNGSRLRIFTLAAGQRTWALSQTMDVPISYGSS
jgi:hypothetical protein